MATHSSIPAMWRSLAESDPEIADAIRNELRRQNSGLELIASENFVSHAVLEAAGASASPRVLDFARVRRAADRIGAKVFTDMAHLAGLVAAGVHPSPVPHSD